MSKDTIKLVVDLGDRSYPIIISSHILENVGEYVKNHLPHVSKCAIVTDETVRRLYSEVLKKSLFEKGIDADILQIPEGEEAKSWREAGELIGRLIDLKLDRRSVIIALGGGVVGDISGFVASIFLRGIRLIQAPTTLLAQVDSGIGGKTAVNHEKGKNLIGSFKQPNLVLIDPEALRTLPLEELKSGMAEVIKYAVIADGKLFETVKAEKEGLLNRETEAFLKIIPRCCKVKAALIEQDERDEEGIRTVLNYGHTVGHALEAASGLEIRHGEAVAIGMRVAAKISTSLGLMSGEDFEEQQSLFKSLGIEVRLPNIDPMRLIDYMRRDKKSERGGIRFILPRGIGEKPVLQHVEEDLIIRIIEELRNIEA
ncbi:MAG: 3-dehydroquinate synthase [Candidatus Bathyarchaeia archaeon]